MRWRDEPENRKKLRRRHGKYMRSPTEIQQELDDSRHRAEAKAKADRQRKLESLTLNEME